MCSNSWKSMTSTKLPNGARHQNCQVGISQQNWQVQLLKNNRIQYALTFDNVHTKVFTGSAAGQRVKKSYYWGRPSKLPIEHAPESKGLNSETGLFDAENGPLIHHVLIHIKTFDTAVVLKVRSILFLRFGTPTAEPSLVVSFGLVVVSCSQSIGHIDAATCIWGDVDVNHNMKNQQSRV